MYHPISLWKIQLQVEKVAAKVCEPNRINYKSDLKLEFIVCKYLGHGRPQYYRRWYARYCSKRVFGHFRWFTISPQYSDTTCDLDTIVGCISSHWEFTRRHSDHFRPHTTHFDLFRCFMLFSMFACLYLTYRYLDGLSMPSPYYSIPIWCVSDLLRPSSTFCWLYLSSQLLTFRCFDYL
jgi:hypothetical protein